VAGDLAVDPALAAHPVHLDGAALAPVGRVTVPGVIAAAEGQAELESKLKSLLEGVTESAGKLQKVVEDNCEYVGDDFADEARAIHYGESEERGIYGEATDQEANELDEEGIDFQRLSGRFKRPRKND